MKNIADLSHKAVWGIAAAYVAGMLVFAVFAWMGNNPLGGASDVKPLYSNASGRQQYFGPPICATNVGDARCKERLVAYGIVDGISASLLTGWYYKEALDTGPVNIVVTFTNKLKPKLQYSKAVALTVSRPDAEDYLKTQFPGSALRQPLGFTLNPSEIVTIPGLYEVSAIESESGKSLDVPPALASIQIGLK